MRSPEVGRVAHPPGFPLRLGGVNEPHAAFLIESRTRCHGWGRAVGNPGSFALFAKGGIPRISIPTVADPTLCKKTQRMGHPLIRGASCRDKHQPRLNRERVSFQKAAPLSRKSGVHSGRDDKIVMRINNSPQLVTQQPAQRIAQWIGLFSVLLAARLSIQGARSYPFRKPP